MSRLRSVSAIEGVVAGGEHVVIRGAISDASAAGAFAGRVYTDAAPANHAAKSRLYAPARDVRC